MLILVLLDQDRKHFEFIGLLGSVFNGPQLFNAGKGPVEVRIVMDGLNIH